MWNRLYEGITISYNPLSHVIFSKNVIKEFKKYQQLGKKDCESGGLLLGYVRKKHFEVLHITTPYTRDSQKRCFFERKDPRHIKLMKKLQKKSNGEICYLGEWHTHPEDYPTPSGIDNHEWMQIRKNRKYTVIFIIIGRKDFYLK